MLFRVDPTSAVSLTDQIATQVRRAIASGELAAGERLPPARELAVSLRVNMHTVLRAYHLLRDEQLIGMRQGRGAWVRDDASAGAVRLADLAAQLVEEARRLGCPPQELHDRIARLMERPS